MLKINSIFVGAVKSRIRNDFDAKPVERNLNVNGDARIFLSLGGQIVVVGSYPEGMQATPPPDMGDGAYRRGFGVAHFGQSGTIGDLYRHHGIDSDAILDACAATCLQP